jgi:hypothetical protein
LAVAFAAALNALVVTTFVWHELASPAERMAGWLALAAWWTGWFVWAGRNSRYTPNGGIAPQDPAEDLFPRAVNEYLRKDWLAAERLLAGLTARGTDVQAELLLVGVWRRTGRTDEARERLERLRRRDAAQAWMWEIEREGSLLGRPAVAVLSEESAPDAPGAASRAA